MSLIGVHCYGCEQSVLVEEHETARGLALAGWAIDSGMTYCPACAAARGLSAAEVPAPVPGQRDGLAGDAQTALEPFPVAPMTGESRVRRAWRLLRASFSVLRGDPQLLIFPAVAMLLSVAVGAIGLAVVLAGAHPGNAAGANGTNGTRSTIFIASLIAAYPLTFVSLYCGVALAAVLAMRLEGRPAGVRDGWTAARGRLGVIAAWTLFVCTVGAFLRLLEQRLPLGGRIAAALVGLSWSLATLFAVPVLAYEDLGPLQTLRRSSQIFKRRWGAQIGGTAGISAVTALVSVPLVIVIVIGLLTTGAAGALLVVAGGVALFAVLAASTALEQIYRVFLYRSAIGLDTGSGPFAARDLQAPFTPRRGRR